VQTCRPPTRSDRRRGTAIVFTSAMIVVLIGFASLTLDVGALYGARADLQNAADAGVDSCWSGR
jgi:Flp pilus assembly protein TadG